MAASPAQLRSLYRSLLRELPPRPILASPRAHIHNRLRTSFSTEQQQQQQHNSLSPAAPGQAQELVAYLRSQRVYIDLVERYNPGMNMADEERIRLSARRVGMDMPVEYKKGSQ